MELIRRARSRALVFSIAIPVLFFAGLAQADPLTEAQARTIVAPFYAGLNAGADVAALLGRATGPSWMSCGGNNECRPLDAVVGSVSGLEKIVPDLKWDIKELLVAGNT